MLTHLVCSRLVHFHLSSIELRCKKKTFYCNPLRAVQDTHTSLLHMSGVYTSCNVWPHETEGRLKVDAAAFDLRPAKGCVDVAEQDCFRLPLLLTLRMTIRSTRKKRTKKKNRTVALRGVEQYTTRPWIIDCFMTEQSN